MTRIIAAVWVAAFVTLVTSAMEFYDAHVLSGAVALLVAVGLGGLAHALTQRYG